MIESQTEVNVIGHAFGANHGNNNKFKFHGKILIVCQFYVCIGGTFMLVYVSTTSLCQRALLIRCLWKAFAFWLNASNTCLHQSVQMYSPYTLNWTIRNWAKLCIIKLVGLSEIAMLTKQKLGIIGLSSINLTISNGLFDTYSQGE